MLDRPQFEHLYLHAHALAELGFVRSLARLMDAPPPEFTPEQHAELAAGVDHALNATEATFDWSALEGIGSEAPAPADPLPGLSFAEAVASVSADPDADIGADPAAYLQQVYAAAPALQLRVDHLWAGADHAAVAARVAALPPLDEPLTQALSPAGWAAWLAAFEAHDAAVEALVAAVRVD